MTNIVLIVAVIVLAWVVFYLCFEMKFVKDDLKKCELNQADDNTRLNKLERKVSLITDYLHVTTDFIEQEKKLLKNRFNQLLHPEEIDPLGVPHPVPSFEGLGIKPKTIPDNCIVINGEVYVLNEKYEANCFKCDLKDQCDSASENYDFALCEILHKADTNQIYKKIEI